MKKVFLDANIILDMIDINRNRVTLTKKLISEFISSGYIIFTSCDIFTTVYYVASKKIDSLSVVEELEKILEFIEVIPIDIDIINQAIMITKQSPKSDMEDVLQYVCAKTVRCDFIVTNDKQFYSSDIKIISSDAR